MRFIVEINDSDLEDGCALCPMNYDYQGCLAFHGSAKDDPMLNWKWDGSPKERPKDCPLIPLSCASCPEMDNPDSYISHLHAALDWHDEHVPRPTNPINTCVVLEGEKIPEEVLFIGTNGVTHYLPEATCRNDGFKDDGEWYFVCSGCGCEFEYTNFACEFAEGHGLGSPKFCPECGARVKEESE